MLTPSSQEKETTGGSGCHSSCGQFMKTGCQRCDNTLVEFHYGACRVLFAIRSWTLDYARAVQILRRKTTIPAWVRVSGGGLGTSATTGLTVLQLKPIQFNRNRLST